MLAGALAAAGAYVIRLRTEEPVLETVTSPVTPYAAFVAAESVHASGVTAVVVASVLLGTQASKLTNARLRLQLAAVNGTVVFLLESVVFGLIGLQLPALIRKLTGTDTEWPLQALVIAATVIVVRLLWVFPLSAVVQRRNGVNRPSWRVPAVVSWAGARGVVPLAAALSIPLVTDSGDVLEHRDLVLLLTTAVIVLTLVVQGFTLAPLVRRAGIALSPEDVRQELTFARLRLAKAGLEHLDQVAETESAPEHVIEQLRDSWQERAARIKSEDADEPNKATVYRSLRRDLLAVEGAELNRLFDTGEITDTTRRSIQRVLDLEQAGLGEDNP